MTLLSSDNSATLLCAQRVASFTPGTVHSAAFAGDMAALVAACSAARAKLALPADVVLTQRDNVLHSTPLHAAAEGGREEAVKHIIAAGAGVDVDVGDGAMVRPLHLAAVHGHVAVVGRLLECGANPTKQDERGDVPLAWAASRGHCEVMEQLLDAGSAVDGMDAAGWTALHIAAANGHVPACRLLLQRGASVNAVAADGRTPLHLAAAGNQLGIMELLLTLGAAQLRDVHGTVPGDVCISDAGRSLVAEYDAARAASARGRPLAAASALKSPQCSAPCGAVGLPPVAPRVRSTQRNANLDADGFPVALEQEPHASFLGPESSEQADLAAQPDVLVLPDVPTRHDADGMNCTELLNATAASLNAQLQGATGAAAAEAGRGLHSRFLQGYGLQHMGMFAP